MNNERDGRATMLPSLSRFSTRMSNQGMNQINIFCPAQMDTECFQKDSSLKKVDLSIRATL